MARGLHIAYAPASDEQDDFLNEKHPQMLTS